MKNRRLHLFDNLFYWIALVLTLFTMVPTDRDWFLWCCLAAVICPTILFSWIRLGPKYILRCLKEHPKQSIFIFLCSITYSIMYAKSFYSAWLPASKLTALTSRIHLSNTLFLWIIIVVVFPCMVCSLFVLLSYLLLSRYRQDAHEIAEKGLVLLCPHP